MIDELDWVRNQRPGVTPPTSEAWDAAMQALERAIQAEGQHRRRRVHVRSAFRPVRVAPIVAVCVAVAVVAVFLGVQSRKPMRSTGRGGSTLVFRAEPTAQVPVVNHVAIARAVAIMRARLAMLLPSRQASATSVTSVGDRIFVRLGPGVPLRNVELVGTTARVTVFDWEANVLTPNGKTVASELMQQDPTALEISQGAAATAPGALGSGSLPLYQAVLLAARQPEKASANNSRYGPEYFMFGRPGSKACAAAAEYYRPALLVPRAYCYLSGPASSRHDAIASLPNAVSVAEARMLIVQRGTAILEATPAYAARPATWSDPSAQFYVLRDRVAMFGNELTNPQASTDQSGAPDVTFQFTREGKVAFRKLTAEIAHRGAEFSGFGQQLNQHFAIALDTQLLTVPSIDYRSYPDGISGANGADMTAGLTNASARALAAQIRLGALPINLRLISVSGGSSGQR